MLVELADALAVAIEDGVSMDELQVVGRFNVNPTGPSIDIYPATASQEDATFGRWPVLTVWTVRARVNGADYDANQDLLLNLLEPGGPTSVRAAIETDAALGALADGLAVDQPSGFNAYPRSDGSGVNDIGCEWRVRIYATANGGTP